MTKIKIAIIGTGFIANYHAKGLQSVPDAEIILSVDTNPEAARKFADAYNIKETATDAMSLVNRDDLDAVIIGIPNKFHAPYAAEFLKNGKDVFLEKPMAMNAAEGRELQTLIETTKQIFMVGHMWRFDTEVNFMKTVVESGKLGEIIKTKGYGIHENWGPEGWFTSKELAGGGALADMGVHAIDTVRYILGDPKPVRVWARIGTYYGDYDVDDSGIITIEWDNGTTSIIESGWWQPHMDMPEAGTQLFGTKGYGTVLPTLLKFKIENYPGTFTPEMPEKKEHCDQIIYTRQMEHFMDCIKSRKQPSPGLDEGQTVLNIVDAAYLSSKNNKVINIQNGK
jgi:predicted dehydrogenase